MRQVKQVFAKIKKTISNINFKSKKTLVFIGLFLVALASSAILISYSYYTNPGTNNLVIGGYAFISDADITLKIYHEDRDAEGNGTGTYSRAYFIPREYYTYVENMSYCTTGLTIESFENYEFDISATQKGFCKVYFEAIDGYLPDATFRLFVEQTMGAGDYEEAGQLPVNDYVYVVNEERTTCSDPNAVVEIVNRQIEVSTSMDLDCEIYADIAALTGGAVVDYLSDTVVALANGQERQSSQTDGGVYRVVNPEVVVPDPNAYVPLTESEYGNVIEYKGDYQSSEPSEDSIISGAFNYSSSTNTWSNNTTYMSADTNTSFFLKIPVKENAYYQICYSVTTAAEGNHLDVIRKSDPSWMPVVSKSLDESTNEYLCEDLGFLMTNQNITIRHFLRTDVANVLFYLQKNNTTITNGNAGIRYQGKDPNNYVLFNGNESWRIIGVFDGSDIGLQNGKKYTKLLINESIGSYSWNEIERDDWTNSSLNSTINDQFLLGVDSDSRTMIAQNVTYYLGAPPMSAYYSYNASQFYMAERGNVGGMDAPSTLDHQNYLGLMYPSDYGYAMFGGNSNAVCTTNLPLNFFGKDIYNCSNFDWMLNSEIGESEWMLNPVSGDTVPLIYTLGSEGIGYSSPRIELDFMDPLPTRPVLYLDSNVFITGGDGSQANPYTLDIVD